MHTFIICGYGIPKDIGRDTNYITYLNTVFNGIFEQAASKPALIIPCGGPTNCTPPYEGTEAQAIADYLHGLIQRPETTEQTALWRIELEKESLSTLENFVFAKKIIDAWTADDSNPAITSITIFCEKTRQKRVQAFIEKIFSNIQTNTAIDPELTVTPIDFDISKNRYLDPAVINKKEDAGLREGLWTLENPERLAKHHGLFEKKFAFLRQRQSEGLSHVDAVKEWFENESDVLRKLMPDHPLLDQLSKP